MFTSDQRLLPALFLGNHVVLGYEQILRCGAPAQLTAPSFWPLIFTSLLAQNDGKGWSLLCVQDIWVQPQAPCDFTSILGSNAQVILFEFHSHPCSYQGSPHPNRVQLSIMDPSPPPLECFSYSFESAWLLSTLVHKTNNHLRPWLPPSPGLSLSKFLTPSSLDLQAVMLCERSV